MAATRQGNQMRNRTAQFQQLVPTRANSRLIRKGLGLVHARMINSVLKNPKLPSTTNEREHVPKTVRDSNRSCSLRRWLTCGEILGRSQMAYMIWGMNMKWMRTMRLDTSQTLRLRTVTWNAVQMDSFWGGKGCCW